MNCPRCTQSIPGEASYCPSCGLDLSTVQADLPETAASQAPEPLPAIEAADADAAEAGSFWPRPLRLHRTRNAKRPFLAATLAFFFGPFAYLYLEQANWFWWGFLGGLFILFLSRGETLPLLVIAYVLHAFDVAVILNEEHRGAGSIDEMPELEPEADLG